MVGRTADLCEMLRVNLDAMKVLTASHAAQYVFLFIDGDIYMLISGHRFMTAAAELVPGPENSNVPQAGEGR